MPPTETREEIAMNRFAITPLAGLALLLAPAASDAARPCGEFEELVMTLEQNATDGDAEVLLFAQGGDEGLRKLTITAPNGRKVARVDGDKRGVGLREFLLESAEPPDLAAVLASFPEGTYEFAARTVSGECLKGEADLSHTLPPAASLLAPEPDEVVPVDALVLSWGAVEGAEAYVVELNDEDTGAEMTFLVFPPTTSLAIPAAVLTVGSEYQFGVGVRSADGNLTVTELTFTTAP
jgi:hypothetical protein